MGLFMKNRAFIFFGIAVASSLAVLYFFKSNETSKTSAIVESTANTKGSYKTDKTTATLPSNESKTKANASAETSPTEPTFQGEIVLNGGNFEGFILKCFSGVPCKLGEDPLKMYSEFKAAGNRSANDHLISFMRSQLKNPDFRDRYKIVLKKIIDDFYPPEEKQFQEAAYYNYLGDLQKSLDTYLDLEKRTQSNPTLRPAPKLNIANTLYDMGRFKESLPYYEAALQESLVSREKLTPNPESFIEGRIFDIKKSLNQ